MATATINGSPSIFQTPEFPTTAVTPDYETRIADVITIATEMADETLTDADWLNDPETVAELSAWHEELDEAWRNDPKAQAEYDAWVTEQERIAIEKEESDFEAHLCSQYDADADELASLGDAGLHAIAGHDAVWQAGGQI